MWLGRLVSVSSCVEHFAGSAAAQGCWAHCCEGFMLHADVSGCTSPGGP